MHPYFFGYGSLVNRNTHDYPDTRRAALRGWRRRWVRTPRREVVFLSVSRDPATCIDGLIAAVPGADWAALDTREQGYARVNSEGAVSHPLARTPEISHYGVAAADTRHEGDHHILLSYLDVVVQGFLREFGRDGVARFFETTDGWDTPVLNDRTAPRYPRVQAMTPQETALVDAHLNALSARVK